MTVVDKATGNRQPVFPKTVASAVTDFEFKVKEIVKSMDLEGSIASNKAVVNSYSRPRLFTVANNVITIYAGTTVLIDSSYYTTKSNVTIDIGSHIPASNRKGKDVYIYAIANVNNELQFMVSLNSTTPAGYTSTNSRKIGGFHCLCAAVGAIANHALTGYAAGDVLPASRWDLLFRPLSEPEGMVYDEHTNVWIDIYLASYNSANGLQSIYGATTADGASTEKFHWYKFNEFFRNVKKRLPFQYEFMSAARGSNQGTNIKNSADPGTTGGFVDTANRRMISDIGCEDMCGNLWQWGYDGGGGASAAEWGHNAFDDNDSGKEAGQHYMMPNRCLLGGSWGNSVSCGSRASGWGGSPLPLWTARGARGCSPLRPAVPIL